MNDIPPNPEVPDGPVTKGGDLSRACESCGQDAVIEIEGKGWCASCLHVRSSCCGKFLEDKVPS
jgi:hypothetical protein